MPKTRPADRRASTSRAGASRPPARPERLSVDVALNGTRASVAASRIKDLVRHVLRAERTRDAMISVALVSSPAIAALNRQYLGHEGPTDVIAFALSTPAATDAFALGDVYVCPAVARTSARSLRIPVKDEIERLVVHGTLHVLGWDHPAGAERERSPMWRRQELLLRRWRSNGGVS